MKKVFFEVGSLDKRCYEDFYLSEDLLMEQAASALAREIKKRVEKNSKVLFLCGVGNNGADGITCARILDKDYEVYIYLPLGAKSPMAKLQLKRARALGVKEVDRLIEADAFIDCLFGSGLKRKLSEEVNSIIDKVNAKNGQKIACDIPTGIDFMGNIQSRCFKADVTITMGALKESLFSDCAKDFVGKIKVANLGISRENYEKEAKTFLLQKSDLKLPLRNKQKTNKGNYGHVSIIAGDKIGASILAASSAFNFGAGLVSIVSKSEFDFPVFLMKNKVAPKTSNTMVFGMGLGDIWSEEELRDFSKCKSLVIDADMFYKDFVLEFLDKEAVLTPHPKEFSSLLKISGFGDFSVDEIQNNRFELARKFSLKYPSVVLLLKGANTLIAQNGTVYINNHGSSILAKGGSGDVLAGLIGAMLAQGYSPIWSAINASLAHALAAKKIKYANYGLNPLDLCEGIKWLQKK